MTQRASVALVLPLALALTGCMAPDDAPRAAAPEPVSFHWRWYVPPVPDVGILIEGHILADTECTIHTKTEGRSRGMATLEAVKIVVIGDSHGVGGYAQSWFGVTAAGVSAREHFPAADTVSHRLAGWGRALATGPTNVTLFFALLDHEHPLGAGPAVHFDCTQPVALRAWNGTPVGFNTQTMPEGTVVSGAAAPGVHPEIARGAAINFTAQDRGFLFAFTTLGPQLDDVVARLSAPANETVISRDHADYAWLAGGRGAYSVHVDRVALDGFPVSGVFMDTSTELPIAWTTERPPADP